MASKIDLISRALILIGDQPINSLTGNDRRQVVANNLYDGIVQDELSKTTWGFAKRKAQLAKTTDTPIDDEFNTVHQLPSDLLRLIKTRPNTQYQIYGSKIYSNMNDTKFTIDYIANVVESYWPPYFDQVIVYALAVAFAPSIRDSASAAGQLYGQYVEMSRTARNTDAQQHPQYEIAHAPFLEVRL